MSYYLCGPLRNSNNENKSLLLKSHLESWSYCFLSRQRCSRFIFLSASVKNSDTPKRDANHTVEVDWSFSFGTGSQTNGTGLFQSIAVISAGSCPLLGSCDAKEVVPALVAMITMRW